MIEYAFGAVSAAVMYTFFPKLAEVPSGWLRAGWAKFKAWKAARGTDAAGR